KLAWGSGWLMHCEFPVNAAGSMLESAEAPTGASPAATVDWKPAEAARPGPVGPDGPVGPVVRSATAAHVRTGSLIGAEPVDLVPVEKAVGAVEAEVAGFGAPPSTRGDAPGAAPSAPETGSRPAAGPPKPAPAPSPARAWRPARGRRRHGVVIASIAALALAVGTVAVVTLRPRGG